MVTASRRRRHEGAEEEHATRDRVVLGPADPTAKEVHTPAILRDGRGAIPAASAALLEGAERGHQGEADRRLGSGHPSHSRRRQAGRQVEPAVSLEAYTRQERPDSVVAWHTGSRHSQVPPQHQREICVLRLEEGD